jgi:hypothetical protein
VRPVTLHNLGAIQEPAVRHALLEIQAASQQDRQQAIAANSVVGNVGGSTAQPGALNQTQLTALINLFSSSASGAVPAAGSAGSGQFLNAAGEWTTPSQSGLFSATTSGLAPASGGGTQNFLRADGSWAQPAQTAAALKTFINITDPLFGGVGNGASDNTQALLLAYLYALSLPSGGKIYFPAGRYYFSAGISLTLPAASFKLAIVGDGADSSVLYWATGGGLTINYQSPINVNNQSVDICDLSFTTGSNGAGVGLTLNQLGAVGSTYGPQTNLINLSFRGDDKYAGLNYWGTGCIITGIANVNLRGCTFQGPAGTPLGTGLVYSGLFSTALAVVCNLDDCIFNQHLYGFKLGDFIQGITVQGSNFTGCTFGIENDAGLSQTPAQLCIVNSQFGTFQAGAGILLQSPFNGLQICNNDFEMLVGQSAALNMTGGSNFTAIGNQIQAGNAQRIQTAAYTSSSGNLALTFTTAPVGILAGQIARVFGLGGTGSVNSLNGSWLISSITNGGLTVNLSTTAGLTLTINNPTTATFLSGTTGFSIANISATGGTISGNVFIECGIAISLTAGSQNVNAGYGNTFILCAESVVNVGTNNLSSGGNLVL